jgi:arginyl-tRNA synthetase
LKTELEQLLRAAIALALPNSTVGDIPLERPRQADHGDFASSIALQLAKAAGCNPRQLAQQIKEALPVSGMIESCDIAGPGFLNFKLRAATRFAVVANVLLSPEQFGRQASGSKGSIQVEFVSSNPTGPLHVGHGRGAAFGASLSNLLDFAGWKVQREYYVNDAGRQMDILTVSTWLRYLSQHAVNLDFPPNGYQGDYVGAMAEALTAHHGASYIKTATEVTAGCPGIPDPILPIDDKQREAQIEAHMDALIHQAKALLGQDWATIHAEVLAEQLDDCRADLEEFGVVFDCWFSEQSLYDSGRVAQVVARLDELGHLYVKDGAVWFKSSAFGDEKDRVVQRENGIYTYFASDIAYHDEKFGRGFDRILNVWGADHHGYIPRVKAALIALGHDASRLVVPLVQFVSLFRNGEKVQMSTRKGQFVTLRELREETGRDAARFFYVLRKSDQALDFDLSLATSESNDNPVYYVQYAHARVHSVLSRWGGDTKELVNSDLSLLGTESEVALAHVLARFPEAADQAATDYAPHSIAFYLRDLAAAFHSCYNSAPFIVAEQPELTRARLALAYSTALVLKLGLSLLGVSAPKQM